MKELEKDEYGLYIYSKNYANCRASVIIAEILKEVNKPKINLFKKLFTKNNC